MDANEIRRLFAHTPAGRVVLTVNGLTYDYVHYRHNQVGTAKLINNNHRFTPFASRLEEDGKIEVQIRCWDFDIDMIEVLDETTGEYHPMWSTDPDYTGGLSRWEHRHYYNLLKQSERGSARQKGRIRAKAKSDVLKGYDDEIYTLGLRDRPKILALIEAEEKRSEAHDCSPVEQRQHADSQDTISWAVEPGGKGRRDAAAPPTQAKLKPVVPKELEPRPPKRPPHYGMSSTAILTRSSQVPAGADEGVCENRNSKFKPRRKTNA